MIPRAGRPRGRLALPALLGLAACAHAPPDPAATAARCADARAGTATSSPADGRADPASAVRRRPSALGPRSSTLADERARGFARHCPHGRPRWWASVGAIDPVVREGYALEHSAEDKLALFVCARVDAADLGGEVPRGERFRADPELPPEHRAELADYARSGYSRGHQAPSADQTRSRDRNDDTFYLSNMTPQVQALNGGLWSQLEKRVRQWAARYGTVWVVTGPMFLDPAEEDATTADGAVEHAVIGRGRVSVPTHYFKVVVAEVDGATRALAFAVANAAPARGTPLDSLRVSIDWIEARTGLDLLPELSPDQEARLERDAAELWP